MNQLSWYGMEPGSFTQTGNRCALPGCVPWTQGLFPLVTTTGKVVNGGIPQLGNLTAHLEALEASVVKFIPAANYSHLAVLDFEFWSPVWAENDAGGDSWHGKLYQSMSLALARKENPHASPAQVAAIAQRDFEAAALEFFTASLKTLRAVRPNATWGFYGLPQGFPPGPPMPPHVAEEGPIWAASDAIFPSVYHVKPNASNAEYVYAQVSASAKLGKPVYPYMMWRYRMDNETRHMSGADVTMCLEQSHRAGAAGAVVWGGNDLRNATLLLNGKPMSFQTYFTTVAGPAVQKFLQSIAA